LIATENILIAISIDISLFKILKDPDRKFEFGGSPPTSEVVVE